MKPEITDEMAVEFLTKRAPKNERFATVPVTRTIVYPVHGTRKDSDDIEYRTFVRMYEFTSPRRWAQALEIEKKYKKLNEMYTKSLKDAGKATSWKPPANPMNFTPLGRE